MAGNVKSPNGQIEVKFSVDNTGRPVYEMTYKGRAVVKPSHLGLELAKDKHASKGMQETDLMDGFKIAKEETTSFDETWQPVWGETKDIRNHYNELAATLEQPATKRPRTSVTTTTNWQQPWSSQPRSGRSSSASGCMTTVSVSVTSSPSSRN